jgi:Ca2+-binding RTX toxin-like protein
LCGDLGPDRIQGNSGRDAIFGGSDGGEYGDLRFGIESDANPADNSLGDIVDYSNAKVQGPDGGVIVDLGDSNLADITDPPLVYKDLCNEQFFTVVFQGFIRNSIGLACNDGDVEDPIFAPGVRGRDLLFGIDAVIGTERDDVIYGNNDFAVVRDPTLPSALFNVMPDHLLDKMSDEVVDAFGLYDNMLFGMGGNDILMGRLGEDLIVGGQVPPTSLFGPPPPAPASDDDILCGDIDDRCDENHVNVPNRGLATFGEHDFMTGDAGDDKLYGDGGDDILRGGTGADFFAGGHGMDLIDYSEFKSDAFQSPDYDPRVIVNLRAKEHVNIRLTENALDLALGKQEHPNWFGQTTGPIAPLFSDAATDDDLPAPIPCAELGDPDVQCISTATDPGQMPAGKPVVPRALDLIASPTNDDQATPNYNETFDRVEGVIGTESDDVVFGAEEHEMTLIGMGGNDVLFAGYDENNIVNHRIYGDVPPIADFLPAHLSFILAAVEPGNDVIEGGLGDDVLDGGGYPEDTFGDVLSYAGSPVAITVNLSNGSQQNTCPDPDVLGINGLCVGAGLDTISDINHVIGSAHDDLLYGDDQRNYFFGGAGDDTFFGNVGDDQIRDGNGEDKVDYQSFIFAIDPDLFSPPSPGSGPDNWIVTQDGQVFTDILGINRPGVDYLFGFSIDEIKLPPDSGPNTDGGSGGGSVPAPVEVTIGEDVEIQPGGSVAISFSATGGVPPYTAKWDPTTVVNTSVSPPRTDTILFWDEDIVFTAGQVVSAQASPLSTTTFRVTVKDSNSPATVDEEFIKVTVADTLEVTAGPDRVIALGQVATFAPAVNGGVQPYAYLWTALSGDGGFVTSTTVARAQVSPEVTTTYSLEVTDALGTVGFDSVEVRVTNPADGDGTVIVPEPDLDDTQQNPGDPDDDDDTGGTDQPEDEPTGETPGQPQTPSDDGNAAPVWCGSGFGSALMAVNLLAFAVMRRRRRPFA